MTIYTTTDILTLFIDFSKAFEHLGIKDEELTWFMDYLHNRKATVKLNGRTCELKDWTTGVPQGSILGPLLYILATNKLPEHLPYVKTYMFADDIAILVTHEDLDRANRLLQHTIIELQKLTHDLGLVINDNKTKIIHFRNRGPTNGFKFTFHNHDCLHNTNSNTLCNCEKRIRTVETHKYLGLTLDSRLTWQPHMDNLSRKLRSGNAAIIKLKYYLPAKT